MDKNAIKKYAVWARRELISRVSQKAAFYGITNTDHGTVGAESVDGHVLTAAEKKQRDALIHQIQKDGYEQTIEEVAYTWFNRFSALRYMEVNGYLPTHVRVFTDDTGALKPQILTEAINLELDGLDMQKVYDLKNSNQDEALYRYLLITQCNALNAILPGMFQKIEDYTELLLPDNLLREGSVIEQMVTTIPEEDWTDQVQIIGWMYQYYNAEKKDDVFAALKKNVKITKENIPAATQLFTPDWIVRYMVENSLGRLWLEGHPDVKNQFLPTEEEQSAYAAGNRDPEDTKWHYYLEEAEQEPEVQAQLAEIRKEYAALTPEQLKVIDPCMGSGHILVYMFDVLVKIYEAYGYSARDAVKSIVENNLYGLDIDDRAAQLAYFAVMMKARQYDRRFFSRGIQPHVYAIVESNHIDKFAVDYFCNGDAKLKKAMETIISELHDAKEYGSILTVTPQDWSALYARFVEIEEDISISREAALKELLPLVQVAEALAQKYDVVVTNPPYMGSSGMSGKLNEYLIDNYPDSKNDLFSVFIERTFKMLNSSGLQAMITQYVWMYKTTYTKFRKKMLSHRLINMVHLGAGAFDEISGEIVNTVSFVNCKKPPLQYQSTCVKLTEMIGEEVKRTAFFDKNYYYISKQYRFLSVAEYIYAYWISQHVFEILSTAQTADMIAAPRKGLTTGDNESFVRLWHEIDTREFYAISGNCWFPMTKGGLFRKWYGNNEYVVDWKDNGYKLKNFKTPDGKLRSVLRNTQYYLRESISWNDTGSGDLAFRYQNNQYIPNASGPCVYRTSEISLEYLMGLFNSKISRVFMQVIAPALKFEVGQISRFPVLWEKTESSEIENRVNSNIDISKSDWDSFETSWDFVRHPLVENQRYAAIHHPNEADSPDHHLDAAYQMWAVAAERRFQQLKANEEELNRIFIDIYGLQDELTPEVEDKDVTVRKADLGRDIRSFISYAVGCMFGRYSLYKDGLIFAGEPYSLEAWVEKMNDQPGPISHEELVRAYHNEGVIVNEMFFPDTDNIIPICDDEYFDDDIVGRFVEFVKTVYGEDTLDENLKFIADALGGKGAPKEVIRNYFMNGFYADHCKTYQKRPIYWLFDSGKKNGFKALIYMHRYQPDTIARIRTDYVHEQQARYRTAIADLEQRIANAATGERVKLNKQLKKLNDQAAEILAYEEKIHHLADQMIPIDLDDGVKVNYAKFQDVLAKIK